MNTRDKPLNSQRKKVYMEEHGNQTAQQLGNTSNSDNTVQASGSTWNLDTGEASSSVDIATLAKEIHGLNERLLLIMEKSLVQKEPVPTNSSHDLLEPTPEETTPLERETAFKNARAFFAGINPHDLKAEKTISLFLAAFCIEGVGCYNRKSIQSLVVENLQSWARPTIVLRGTSLKTLASKWGPFNEIQPFLMHREGESIDLDPATRGELDKISAAWPKSLQINKHGALWDRRCFQNVYITSNDRGYPVSLNLPHEVSPHNSVSYSIYSGADTDFNELGKRATEAKVWRHSRKGVF
jgi:hypothetical protein